MSVFFIMLLFFSSSVTACDRCVHRSKAAYFSSDSPLSSGACGYGSSALSFNGGFLAAGVPSWFKNGARCGACFQIRCKRSDICSKSGTKVIMTDLNTNSQVDFVVSNRAFKAMAKPGKEREVEKLGIADVEYKRIPCDYKGKNLAIRVEDSSSNPGYLAIKILYQGGQTEIVAIDVAPVNYNSQNFAHFYQNGRIGAFNAIKNIDKLNNLVGSANWTYMSRNYGAVWDTSRVPSGPLQFRFVVTSGYDGKTIWAKNVLPGDWRPGVLYDTKVQINDIAQESCSPCDTSQWK